MPRVGSLWLLLDERNNPRAVAEYAAGLGLSWEQLSRKKVTGELLYIFRLRRYFQVS